jgi:hypothetical protein
VRLIKLGLLGLLVPLSACGSSAPIVSLTLRCNGAITVAGAQSIDVAADPARGTLLSFPDPVNPGHTGAIPVAAGQKCTVTPETKVGG